MACRLFDHKPLPEPMLTYCQFQWNLNRNTKFFIHENTFENVVWEVAAILFWGIWVNAVGPPYDSVDGMFSECVFCGMTMPSAGYSWDHEMTKDTLYLALMDALWSVFSEYFWGKLLWYIEAPLWCSNCSVTSTLWMSLRKGISLRKGNFRICNYHINTVPADALALSITWSTVDVFWKVSFSYSHFVGAEEYMQLNDLLGCADNAAHKDLISCVMMYVWLTPCGLMMPYVDADHGKHWLR